MYLYSPYKGVPPQGRPPGKLAPVSPRIKASILKNKLKQPHQYLIPGIHKLCNTAVPHGVFDLGISFSLLLKRYKIKDDFSSAGVSKGPVPG